MFYSIPYNTVPDSEPITSKVSEFIKKNNRVIEPIVNTKKVFRIDGLSSQIQEITPEIKGMIKEHGVRPYRSRFSDESSLRAQCWYYSGLSVTYNRDNKIERDPYQAAFGKPRSGIREIFFRANGNPNPEGLKIYEQLVAKKIVDKAWFQMEEEGSSSFLDYLKSKNIEYGIEFQKLVQSQDQQIVSKRMIKGDFSDNYAFRHLTPAFQTGSVFRFLKKIKRSLIRSRLAVIDSSHYEGDFMKDYSWHCDESLFLGVRINIPIFTNEHFFLETDNYSKHILNPGFAYSWNTSNKHRVYCDKKNVGKRGHLVLALSPWFDYDSLNDTWVTNEFFAKKHPFDMINDGDFFEGTKIHEDDLL